ncbi:MAG: sigma-70 family RNA polymerase sigma factor [Chloroflexota bacterium]
MQSPDAEVYLLERAVRRDKVAFTALYERYLDRVYKYAYYWLSDQADAEDIAQEVFVRAWQSIDRYKVTAAPFIAWLTTIARNLIASHYRATKRLVPFPETEPMANSADDPEVLTEASFNRNYIRAAITKLSGEKQKVIQMRFISDMSYEEVALALHKSEGAIRVIQYRALQDLRRILVKKQK